MALCSPAGIDIRADVWHGVLEHLFQDPKSILSLCQVRLFGGVAAIHGHQYRCMTYFVPIQSFRIPFSVVSSLLEAAGVVCPVHLPCRPAQPCMNCLIMSKCGRVWLQLAGGS